MTPQFDPGSENRRTSDGAGAQWDLLREETLERDEYTCQRCGYRQGDESGAEPRRLEAHNIAPYGTASLESPEELVTVCGPCHATLHSDDPAYGDLREAAPMFPQPDAPPAVSTMRSDRQHVCQRCQYVGDSATELASYTEDGTEYVLCRPCAGVLLVAGYDAEAFHMAGELDTAALCARAPEAPVRPALLASRAVRTDRPPETTLERIVYDTPLRYILNPLGMTLLFIVVGVLASFYVF